MSRKKNNRRPQNVKETNKENDLIISITRSCVPGNTDCNNNIYDIESYEKALNEFVKSGAEIFFVDNDKNPYANMGIDRSMIIDLRNVGAEIISVGNDSILYKIKDQRMYDIITDFISDGGKVTANMRYFGYKVKKENETQKYNIEVERIVTFDIIIRDGHFPFRNYEDFSLCYNKGEEK